VNAAVLVMAKAPVPGQVKTRLAASVGYTAAAELAAASLLDTLDVCETVFDECHLALAGDLRRAAHGHELRMRTVTWSVHDQCGNGFADRLAHAHAEVGRSRRRVVQIGMDTPHVSASHLRTVARAVGDGNDAVLGPAEDGGWWVLAVTDATCAAALRTVTMSTEHTCYDTRRALEMAGASVQLAATLRDVDTATDAQHVAARAPGTRFGRLWLELGHTP
jgi:rSAM/selenodomain-associated transferase 1